MKTTLAILLAFAVTAAAVEPRNELERAASISRRVISSAQVDIAPLIKWRKTRQGPRPLTSWHYMTGKILRWAPGQWLVEAQMEDEADVQKIILRHPPEAALAQFNWLQSEYESLKENAEVADAIANGTLEAKADARTRMVGIDAPDRARTIRELRARQAKNQAYRDFKRSQAESASAQEHASVAAKRLKQFDSMGYDLKDDFTFFGYALKTQQIFEGNLPIFDCGLLISQ